MLMPVEKSSFTRLKVLLELTDRGTVTKVVRGKRSAEIRAKSDNVYTDSVFPSKTYYSYGRRVYNQGGRFNEEEDKGGGLLRG